ncbi:hypothetical protein ABL78_3098 [Leptomonas seymouri]|uniref:Scaffold protein Nfu/NifU N-terminal domain-containing protein n=1 Tax=Leptomonas seymouri TaxID=5684 RepID=A0A0N0P6M8_LEPSE|nr:hypothetical protein ABL78_3098 [Leptomonas seymouri]|eukprot:KPI87799.1 hypothetical protein ABL78_3098 [Leptomonas seymouri]
MRGRGSFVVRRRAAPVRLISTSCFSSAAAVGLRAKPHAPLRFSPFRRCSGAMMRRANLCTNTHSTFAERAASDWVVPSSIFVRFQPTPNDACYKFYVDDMAFLPPGVHTMMFDSTNSYQSPLAHTLLEALPMVEEVTIGASFVTVRRVEEADAKAAARFFAMRFHGVQAGQMVDESAAAARSQALQQHVNDVREETKGSANPAATAQSLGNCSSASPKAASCSPEPSGFAEEAPIELGGFTVSPSAQDEQIDESAVEALITSTDWSELKLLVSALLTDHIGSGSPHVDPSVPNPHADTVPEEGDSEVVLMIKELVATTIRPQLQDDGGDLRFVGFDADCGEVRVELLGACRTCKSSKTTLVDLIERTTRHWIPEVKAVTDVLRTVSLSQRYAEESVAEAGYDLSVTGLLQSMELQQSGVIEPGEETSQTVQFTPSSSNGAPDRGYRIVREVKASARGQGDGRDVVASEGASSP